MVTLQFVFHFDIQFSSLKQTIVGKWLILAPFQMQLQVAKTQLAYLEEQQVTERLNSWTLDPTLTTRQISLLSDV